MRDWMYAERRGGREGRGRGERAPLTFDDMPLQLNPSPQSANAYSFPDGLSHPPVRMMRLPILYDEDDDNVDTDMSDNGVGRMTSSR